MPGTTQAPHDHAGPPRAISPGDRVGGYVVERVLGRGGMGVVFLARDLDLDRPVALKVIDAARAADPEFRDRFMREWRVVAMLDHPNIVSVYRAGDDDGRMFMAMRYVAGSALADVLDNEGRRPPAEAAQLVVAIAAALEAAHQTGLVHRDVKPANVLVAGDRTAFLTDFGIALGGHTDERLTQTGQFVGTPAYVAPEQIRGGPIGPAIDVYALGCVLYHCLTGAPPFRASTTAEVLTAHLNDPPPLPSAGGVTALYDEVVAVAMAKSPQARYASAAEFADAVHAVDGRAPTSMPARRKPAPRPGPMLPPTTTTMVGRDTELATLEETLTRSPARLVTLVGAGGTGKSRLALELAHRAQTHFPDGAYFVELAPVAEADRVLTAIAQGLGLQAADALRDTIAAALARRRVLLVLDNFEHVLPAAGAVIDLLADAPDARVLVTSRTPLHLSSERVMALAPLDMEAAVSLFTSRAQDADPQFELTPANEEAVRELCRHLDCLPLALGLAAARMRAASPSQILERLDRRLQILSTRAPDVPERHRSLQAAIEWSHDLLAPAEARLFAQLGVFAGATSLEAVEAVFDDKEAALGCLEALIDHNLVFRDQRRGEPRYRMLESVAEFARQKLSASGAAHDAMSRHAAFHRDMAEEAALQLRGREQAGALMRLDLAVDDLLAALDHARSSGDTETELAIAAKPWQYWESRPTMGTIRDRLDELLSAPGDASLRLRAEGHFAATTLAARQVDVDALERHGLAALALAEAVGDPPLAAMAANARAMGYWAIDTAGAVKLAREAAERSERAGDPWVLAFALNTWGSNLMFAGDAASAQPLFERSLEMFRALGDRWDAAYPQHNIAFCLAWDETGAALAEAQRLMEGVIGELGEVEDRWLEATASLNLAVLLLARRDLTGAATALRRALLLARSMGMRQVAEEGVWAFGDLCAERGQTAAAAELWAAAEADRLAAGKVEILPPAARRRHLELRQACGTTAPVATPAALEDAIDRHLGLLNAPP